MKDLVHYGSFKTTEQLCGKDVIEDCPSIWSYTIKEVTCKACICLIKHHQLSDNSDYQQALRDIKTSDSRKRCTKGVFKMTATELAKLFHETYERLAPDYGYETREDTKEFKVDSPNGMLMIAVCYSILNTPIAQQSLSGSDKSSPKSCSKCRKLKNCSFAHVVDYYGCKDNKSQDF